MPIAPNGIAPYAPSHTILGVVRRYRGRGLTAPFDADVLMRAGVSESLVPRTLQSLKLLELVDDSGMPTPHLVALGQVPTADYPKTLAEFVRSVYVEVFKFADPAKDVPERIEDAFRSFRPRGQQGRMVTLFMALCEEAGIIPEGTNRARPGEAPATQPRKAPKVKVRNANAGASAGSMPSMPNLPPALAGLMAQVPSQGWTKERRDAFLATLSAVLDFCIPITEVEQEEDEGVS